MVGVAGRSKACTTCKIRHVRCDARHPTCQRCEAGAFTCLGYERPMVFIDQTNQIREMVTKLQSNVIGLQLSISQTSELDRVRLPPSASIYHFHFQSHAIGCGDSFRRQASMYDEIRAFMDRVLMRQDTKFSCGLQHEDPVALAVAPMLGTTVESVALYMYGKYTQNITKVYQAFKLHGQTLDQLRAVISRHYQTNHQSITASAPLLVIIMNMVLYEFMAPTTKSAWKDHVRGLEALINKYGPAMFHQEPMRRAFEQARMHIVVAHLDDVQRTILEQPLWQEVPWRDQAEPKSIINYYIDILCCIPGLLENKNRLFKGLSVEPKTLRSSISRQTLRLYVKLLQVRWLWEVSNPSCCHEIPAGRKSPAASLLVEESLEQPLFESLLVFNSLQRAIETNLYNCCMLFLCDIATQLETLGDLKRLPMSQIFDSSCSFSNLHGFFDGETESAKTTELYTGVTQSPYAHKTNPALAFPNELSTWNLAAYEICRSIEFMMQPNHGPAGAYFAIFPLRVAQISIDAWSKAESRPKLSTFLRGQFTGTINAPGPIPNKPEQKLDATSSSAFRRAQGSNDDNCRKDDNINEKNHCILVLQWARCVMRCIADEYGFSVTRNFN